MNRATVYALVTALVVVIAAAVFFSSHKPSSATTSPSPSLAAKTSPAASGSPASAQTASATTVTYGDSGFSPAEASLKSGGQITFKNTTSQTIQVDSNPHPQHTDNTQLNVGQIAPGASATVTLTTTGTWGFHNHLDPTMTGKVMVQ